MTIKPRLALINFLSLIAIVSILYNMNCRRCFNSLKVLIFMLFVATDKCTKGDGPFSIGVCNSQFGFCFEGNYSVEVKRSID